MKYKIGYYIIDDDSITIMFYDSMFLGQTNVPTQLYISKNDYRYEIIKYNLLKQSVGDNELDSEWFQIPALTNIEELNIDDFGNVSYYKNNVSIKSIDSRILKKLIDYSDTPIYKTYLEIIRNNGWFISKINDMDKYTVAIPNVSLHLIVFTVPVAKIPGMACYKNYCAITDTPYVATEFFESKNPNIPKKVYDESSASKSLMFLVGESIEQFDKVLEDFWKCSLDEFSSISKHIANNNIIFEKLINKINQFYEINPDVIPFIASNTTDIVKLHSLLLTGMITKRENLF